MRTPLKQGSTRVNVLALETVACGMLHAGCKVQLSCIATLNKVKVNMPRLTLMRHTYWIHLCLQDNGQTLELPGGQDALYLLRMGQ